MQNKERKKVIERICNDLNIEGRIDIKELYIYKEKYKINDIREEEFGYRLAKDPYEAYIYDKAIIICPKKEEDNTINKGYIAIKSMEYEHVLADYIYKLSRYITDIENNEEHENMIGIMIKDKTWEDLYIVNEYYSSRNKRYDNNDIYRDSMYIYMN